MDPNVNEEIFSEEEKRALLDKIIHLLNNHEFIYHGPSGDYERYKIKDSERDPMDFGRKYMMRVFTEYGFTNQELRFMFNKIVECEPKKYYQYKDSIRKAYNSITKSDTLTNSELITIFLHLKWWQYKYRGGYDTQGFLCGNLQLPSKTQPPSYEVQNEDVLPLSTDSNNEIGCPSKNRHPKRCQNRKDYHVQSKIFHPDKNRDCISEATSKFQTLNRLCNIGIGGRKNKRTHKKIYKRKNTYKNLRNNKRKPKSKRVPK